MEFCKDYCKYKPPFIYTRWPKSPNPRSKIKQTQLHEIINANWILNTTHGDSIFCMWRYVTLICTCLHHMLREICTNLVGGILKFEKEEKNMCNFLTYLYKKELLTKPNCFNQPSSKLKYGFCKKSLRKNEKKSEPKVFNWSEFHFF